MAEFILATEEELVEPDWGIIVECGGIDFEAGGTLTIVASHRPGLQLKLVKIDIDELKKHTSNQLILKKLMSEAKPRLDRSLDEKKFLAIDFVLRVDGYTASWIMQRDSASIERAISEFFEENRNPHVPDAKNMVPTYVCDPLAKCCSTPGRFGDRPL